MIEKLTVLFFIILCLILGAYLILSPWTGLFGSWDNNYLLVFVADKTDLPILQKTVASTWFRGAVTGLGVLNIIIACWEMAHFGKSVEMLKEKDLGAIQKSGDGK